MKKTIFLISILSNIAVASFVIFFFSKASFSTELDEDKKVLNYDSIAKSNKIKIVELTPEQFKSNVSKLSKQKKCVVIFWTSWCKYCPELIKLFEEVKSDKKYNFNYILVSLDKPNEKGKSSVLKKASILNLKNEVFITNLNDFLDISNSKTIYDYLPVNSKFDLKPGFPHILIFDNNKLIFEDTGLNKVYGISEYVDLLK